MFQKFGIEQAESIIDVNVQGEISARIFRFDCRNESRSSVIASRHTDGDLCLDDLDLAVLLFHRSGEVTGNL